MATAVAPARRKRSAPKPRPRQVAPVPVDPYELVGELIERVATSGHDFVPADEARRIDAIMRDRHPREHEAFLRAESYRLYLAQLKAALHAARRSAHRATSSRARFGEATQSDDPEAMRKFVEWTCQVDEDNTQRPIGQMTAKDHRFVAKAYGQRKTEFAMLEAFHNALARRCGPTKRTEDVMSEAEFTKLYDSIVTH